MTFLLADLPMASTVTDQFGSSAKNWRHVSRLFLQGPLISTGAGPSVLAIPSFDVELLMGFGLWSLMGRGRQIGFRRPKRMKRQLLSAVAAAALIVGMTAASQAQDAEQPASQEVCPPDKCPPKGGAGEAPAAMPEEQSADQMQPAEGQAAQQPADEAKPAEGQTAEQPLPEDQQQQAGQKVEEAKPGDEPTHTGSTNAKVDINEEQATEIRTAVKEVNVEPVDVDFEINIGVAVPRTVVLHPLPRHIVEVVPVYEGFQFFILADGTIVIVDPGTFQVVYVLYA
jgi:hypothetical protein